MNDTSARSVADTDLFDYGPERSQLLVQLWRALAKGTPLDDGAVSAAARRNGVDAAEADAFLRAVTERDERNRVVGLLGLSLRDHPHRFTVEGRALSTWCAVDTLFLPVMLGMQADIESRSPVSGRAIRLTVGPRGVRELDPPPAAVSLPVLERGEVDTSSTEGIWKTFCHRIYFFADAPEAEGWIEGRGAMEVVSVEGAWRHAMKRWSKVLPYV